MASGRSDEEALMKLFIANNGIPRLQPHDEAYLFPAEQLIQIRRKSQILVDVWTPWLEGLAVYGELGADPDLDPIGINPVTLCLLNLTDLFYDENSSLSPREQVEKHIREFTRRCGEALRLVASDRLEEYLRLEDQNYFKGYVAVRAIASRWRLISGRNLSSARVFGVLLRATRFATEPYIPDLSLEVSKFADAACSGMATFVLNMANLHSSDLNKVLREMDSSNPLVGWADGVPFELAPDHADELVAEAEAVARVRIKQAEQALMSTSDLTRFEARPGMEWAAVTTIHKFYWQRRRDQPEERSADTLEMYEGFLNLNSIMPIGRCSAPFYLQIYETAGTARLFINIRTAEEAIDTGKPSYNMLAIPIPVASAKSLAEQYAKHGSPRLRVTRVVILRDIQQDRLQFPQFFAFEYPGWFEMRGSSGWSGGLEERAPKVWAGLVELVRRRLVEPEIQAIERRYVAGGREVVEHIHQWAADSPAWQGDGVKFELGSWASHLTRLCEQVLNPGLRNLNRGEAASAMLTAIYGDTPLAAALAAKSFPNLLARHPRLTQSFANAFYETGRAACTSAFLDQNHALLTAAGMSLLENAAFGWDVRPALQQRRA